MISTNSDLFSGEHRNWLGSATSRQTSGTEGSNSLRSSRQSLRTLPGMVVLSLPVSQVDRLTILELAVFSFLFRGWPGGQRRIPSPLAPTIFIQFEFRDQGADNDPCWSPPEAFP